MGDFDRNPEQRPGKQNKQIAFAIVLAVVLIGVLGFHFMKPGPQVAMAGAPPALAGPSMPMPDDTAEQAANALKNDPTARLLRENGATEADFASVPRNPFVLSAKLRSDLVHQIDLPTPTIQATPDPVRPVRVAQPVKVDAFKLASIMRANDKFMAIINGHIASAGMVVDGARIVEIREDRVILQNAQFPDGPTAELTIDAKLK